MLNLSAYDKKVYNDELKDFLPDKIIDCHTHVYLEGFFYKRPVLRGSKWAFNVGGPDNTVEDLIQMYKEYFPGKEVTPVIFSSCTNTDYSKSNPYLLEKSREFSFPCLYNTSPDMPPDMLEEGFADGFGGVKPYLANALPYIPEDEIRIFDFLTHEQLKVINAHKKAVMMHIPRHKRLRDPVNIAQLLEIEQKYPDVKLIVAHVGRAYAPEDIGDAFTHLSKTERMMFDFSANTLDTAIKGALDAVGAKRVLFGTDLPITIMRMRRISENGEYINIVRAEDFGDVTGQAHMRNSEPGEELTHFTYEILRAAKRAMSGCTRQDAEDVFYNNAKGIFNHGVTAIT